MSPRPKIDLDRVSQQCTTLSLTHIAECLPELVETAARDELAPVGFLEHVLEREI